MDFSKLTHFLSEHRKHILTTLGGVLAVVGSLLGLHALVNWWVDRALDKPDEPPSPPSPNLPPAFVFRTPEQQAEYDESIRIRTTIVDEALHQIAAPVLPSYLPSPLPGRVTPPSPAGSDGNGVLVDLPQGPIQELPPLEVKPKSGWWPPFGQWK